MTMARQSDLSSDPGLGVPVLITRPRDQGQAFAESLTTRFGARVRAVLAPLMETQFLTPPLPEGSFAAVVFTSANGVEGARRLQLDWPRLAYCVGQATAAAAARAGFDARSADGDVSALVRAILSDAPTGNLMYIRGVDTVGELEKHLISKGFRVLSLQVYLQAAIPFQREPMQMLRRSDPVIVPLFSPRSAQLFREALPKDVRADLHLVAISPAVAAAASGVQSSAVAVAARPDALALLDAIETLLPPSPSP
jgi:uroporphyrinogen-III synthase